MMDTDCYSIDSEILGTLDYLRPPVKRDNVNIEQDYLGYLIGASDDEKFARDFTKIYKTERKKNCQLLKQCIETSPSLILQKTCRHEIIEKYASVNSKKSIEREKQTDEKFASADQPIIKVTIVPKTDQQPLIHLLKKHKEITNSLRKTALTSENTYQAKNLYLVVAGNAGEKIYEVKTKGSTTCSCKTLRDIVKTKHVKQSNDKTQQIRFHKMERKKKKQTKEIKIKEAECSNVNKCACKFCTTDLEQDRNDGAGSVKIFGRIRLDEHDKYFLNCKATINGQPVSTSCSKVPKTLCDVSTNRSANKTKNQSTQVDLSVKIITPCQTIDQNIQCNCNDYKNASQDVMSAQESEINGLKASNSPLVIVSVYPKHDSSFGVKATPDISFPNELTMQSCRALQSNRNEDNKVNTFIINTDLHNTRQPSPKRVNLLKFQSTDANKTVNKINKLFTTKPNRASRPTSPKNRSQKLKIQEVEKQTFVKNNILKSNGGDKNDKTNARDKSPYRYNDPDRRSQRDTNVSKQNKIINVNNRIEIRKQRKANLRSQSATCDKSINTEKVEIKNVSVEKNTKKATNNQQKNSKKSIVNAGDVLKDKQPILKSYPKHETSKVSVNIDSEKEYYDVIFEKGKFCTDLTVRKMTKENGAQKYFENFEDDFEKTFNDNDYYDDNRNSGSLENFFPIETTGHHRRSVSQAFNSMVDVDGYPVSEHVSRLAVRDSLEICHRRDAKDINIQSSKRLFLQNCGEDFDGDFLAPIKHYTGDNCMTSDPVKRDKEIRELLGIEKIRTDKKQTDITRHKMCTTHHRISTHHLFQGALCNSLLTSLMLQKACSCPFCTGRISMTFEPNRINFPRKKKENNSIDEKQTDLNIASGLKTAKQVQKEDMTGGVPIMISESIQYKALENLTNLNQEQRTKQKAIYLSRKQYIKVKKSIRKCQRQKGKQTWNSSIVSIGNIRAKTKSAYLIHWNQGVQTDSFSNDNGNSKKSKRVKKIQPKDRKCGQRNAFEPTNNYSQKDTVVLYCRDTNNDNLHGDTRNTEVRKIASSAEIRYSNGSYVREMAYSFRNFESLGSSNLERKRNKSIETIFRCHGKTHTPNLGASALSLLSEDMRSVSKSESLPLESRPKKPFLRRLMSCLVMRSARTSEVKIAQRKPQPPTIPSSFDSYNVSTSLGAVEMSSSVYDTSASFYSNHTIGPITNKTKRGFLNSVRGFLATRKS